MEYQVKSLGSLTNLITKGTTPSNIGESFTDEGVMYFRSELVGRGKYIDKSSGLLFISEETHKKLKRSQIKPGDLLFSMAGAYLGKISLVSDEDVPSNTNQAVAIIRFKPGSCNVEYAYYFMSQKWFTDYVYSFNAQAAQPNINLEQIGKLIIALPSLHLQNRVVSILSAYDRLIELNNKRINVLEQMVENLYKEWFVRFRFPGHKTAEFENGIPKGWTTKTLNEWMSDSFNGGWGEEEPTPKTPDAASVIRGTDIEDVKTARYCEVPRRYHKEKDIRAKELKENDIVLELSNGNINNIGRTLFVTKSILSHFDKVICASFCKTLRFPDRHVAFFVWRHIEYLQNSGILSFYKNTGANGINNFNFKRFLRMPISIPNDFSMLEVLMHLHGEISVLQEKNFILIKQRDLLLPRLMSGKLEVV